MKIVILDKSTLGEDIDLSPIYSIGEVQEYDSTACELVAERVADAEVVVINKVKLTAENLKDAEKLRLICVAATGFDNIDTEYCRRENIALCNVPGYSTDSVAQVTLSMVLSLVTHLGQYRSFVHSGEYSKSGIPNRLTPVYREVSTMKWGVVGGGAIGMKVATVASSMGCEVVVCRRKQEGEFPVVDIDTLCETCDIISIHLPLTEETRNIISKERIAKMKRNAVVVNTARGAVADEEALAEAVLCGEIGALGVDVYSAEPFPGSHPFNKILDRENVCLTPHMAWGSKEARARCVEKISENIVSFYRGENKNRIV
ncbi:MAG: NAD(P)-dependent oxidoreductase [Eubacteriales bacterium]|nr:NAD(P)-dependent oxidoreductase [Eubacteriales bacterium]